MANPSQKLINYPKTLAFIARELASFEEQSVTYFIDALKDYEIGQKLCGCGHCYTFSLLAPDKKGVFKDLTYCGHFGNTTAILSMSGEGHIESVELPDEEDHPFKDEYKMYGTDYKSPLTLDEANQIVKKWFEDNPVYVPHTIYLDNEK